MNNVRVDLQQTIDNLRPEAVKRLMELSEQHDRKPPGGLTFEELGVLTEEVARRTQLVFWDRLNLCHPDEDVRNVVMTLALQVLQAETSAIIDAFVQAIPPEELLKELLKRAGIR